MQAHAVRISTSEARILVYIDKALATYGQQSVTSAGMMLELNTSLRDILIGLNSLVKKELVNRISMILRDGEEPQTVFSYNLTEKGKQRVRSSEYNKLRNSMVIH